jgi:hypothetical protein
MIQYQLLDQKSLIEPILTNELQVPPLPTPTLAASTNASTNKFTIPIDTEDRSMLKLSDTASHLSAFEVRFNAVTNELSKALCNVKIQAKTQSNDFKEQKELLQSILRALSTQANLHLDAAVVPLQEDPAATHTPDGEQIFTSSDKAIPLSQMGLTGGPEGADGNDS